MFVKLCDKNTLPVGELRAFKVKAHEIFAVNLGNKFFVWMQGVLMQVLLLQRAPWREKYLLARGIIPNLT